MRKIGILTQPLHQNYGGLLQAYALKTVLIRLGYNPIILDRNPPKSTLVRKIGSHVKTIIYKLLGRNRNFSYWLSKSDMKVIAKNTDYFISNYIQEKSPKLHSTGELEKFISNDNFYGFVVGSDQVWRPRYSPHIPTYFLDFAKDLQNVKRISYAASFGVSDWEFSPEEESIAKELIKLFGAVSVREDSGVELCEKYLNTKAVHVLDPTMLLTKDDYIALVEKENEPKSAGNLFTYVLDPTEHSREFIKNAENELGLKAFEVQPKHKGLSKTAVQEDLQGCVYPSVTKWLRAFVDADFVITDSFHGCVFSIIFNKPFVAIGNKARGLARFESLLNIFDLGDRLNSSDFNTKIDWKSVNENLAEWKEFSINYLKESLNGKS